MKLDDFLISLFQRQIILFAFGETHHGTHQSVISEIVKHLNLFSGIFLEKPVSMQPAIDEYISTSKVNERLESHFQNALKEGKDIRSTLLTILDAARENNKPVHCVDSSKEKTEVYNKESTVGRYFLRTSSRDEDMSLNITEKLEKDKKYLFIGGFQHLLNGIHFRTGEPTLGYRLHHEFGEAFYSCVLIKVIAGKIGGYDLHEKVEPEVTETLKEEGISIRSEIGKLTFDGYVLHR